MSSVPQKCQFHVQGKINERRLSTKKLAAEFIQDLGRHLKLSKKCIYSALVYMGLDAYCWNTTGTYAASQRFEQRATGNLKGVGVAALFLAAKYEDEPRPLEHVIKVSHMYMFKGAPILDVNSEVYTHKRDQVLTLENILLQTLGFNLEVEPHALSQAMKQSAEKDGSSTGDLFSRSSTKRKLSLEEYKNSKRPKVGTSNDLPLTENVNKMSHVPSTENNSHKLSMKSCRSKENFRTESSVRCSSSESGVKWRLIPITLTPKKKAHTRRVLSIEDYRRRK